MKKRNEQSGVVAEQTSPSNTIASGDSTAFSNVKTYGKALLFVLFVLYVITFFSFKWLETQEIRQELTNTARAQKEVARNYASTSPGEAGAPDYPDGIVILNHAPHTRPGGFSEQTIGNTEYLVYDDPVTGLVLAKPEDDTHREISRFLLLLMVLYFGQALVLFGWWQYVKDQIAEIFPKK